MEGRFFRALTSTTGRCSREVVGVGLVPDRNTKSSHSDLRELRVCLIWFLKTLKRFLLFDSKSLTGNLLVTFHLGVVKHVLEEWLGCFQIFLAAPVDVADVET